MCLSIAVQSPERVLGSGAHQGFDWMVTRNNMGFRCGYVRVPKGHPWYGQDDYNYIDADVHGGLTFSEADEDCGKGPDDGWWVGFDCGHSGDAPDPALPGSERMIAMGLFHGDHVWTQEEVVAECKSLCEQAAAAK